MTQLPYDVWLHISQFLPEGIAEDLLGLNASMFQIGMTARYRTVTLSHFGRDTMKALDRLR